jgi:hypothetical protein
MRTFAKETMNRFIVVPIAAILLVACGEAPKTEIAHPAKSSEQPKTTPSASQPLSAFAVTNPAADAQMIHGFYPVEASQWRWVGGKFGVLLGAPEGASQRGAHLELKFNYPQVIQSRLKTITLAVTANGAVQNPQKYEKFGDQTYETDLPANLVRGGLVTVEFSTDKVVPAGQVEARELALIVTEVGLTVSK